MQMYLFAGGCVLFVIGSICSIFAPYYEIGKIVGKMSKQIGSGK
jgi:hypothetical protein